MQYPYRGALRNAELGVKDAQRSLESARAEGHALSGELERCRERQRQEILRLSEKHDAGLKECADRLFAEAPILKQSSDRIFGGGGGGRETAAVSAALRVSPVASAIAGLADKWESFVAREYRIKRCRIKCTFNAATARSVGRCPNEKAGGSRCGDGVADPKRQQLARTFLQEIATRLDAECSRAVRRARAFEWELRGSRQEALDASTALEEARVEVARLSARMTAAEAVVITAASSLGNESLATGKNSADVMYSNLVAPGSVPGVGWSGASSSVGDGDGEVWWTSSCTVAATFLLEKRLATAMEDLIATKVARAAAEEGEAAATSRAETAEARTMNARAATDVLGAELERHKSSASDELAAESTEWRREIRSELGRWWRDDLVGFVWGGIRVGSPIP